MRILGIERDDKACNHYRIAQPLNKLIQHDLAMVEFIKYGDQLDSAESFEKIFNSDVIVLPRPSTEEWFTFVKACRKAGKLLVSDYDDDPFTTSPWNPYYRWIGVENWNFRWPDGKEEVVWQDGMKGPDGEEWFNIEKNINRRDMCRANFKKSDLVTSTTPVLQDTFSKINKNSVVLPNLLDFDIFPQLELVKKKLRIGWQGGVSHYEDLHVIKEALHKLSEKYDFDFVYFGDNRIAGPVADVKNFIYERWVPNAVYPYKLATMNIDIGLCPLQDNVFNRNKSAIKYFEYSAVGAATVASNIPPYSPVIKNGETGLLVENTTKAWVDAIESLILDKEKRSKMASKAYEDVYENHNADKKAHMWVDAYEEAIRRESVLEAK